MHFILLLQETDPVISKIYDSTEEGQKVTRNSGEKYLAVFRRIVDPYKYIQEIS